MSNNEIIMYTTQWCGDCRRAKRFFNEYGISYTEVDIEQRPEAIAEVEKLNRGMRSVPTILFADGSVLVEPSYQQLAEKTGVVL